MVFEFAELQGIIGKYYANESGENKEVAAAIEEHYMPTGRDGSLPGSDIGALLSITDKIDNISSCFSVGLKPTGSADPYALRRQAIGIIQIVLNNELNLDLENIFNKAVKLVPGKNAEGIRDEIITFLVDRFKNFLIDEGYTNTVIDSVISTGFSNIIEAYNKIKAVEKFSKQKEFEELAVTFKRVVNIAKEKPAAKLNTKLFKDSSEKNLFKTFSEINKKTETFFKPGKITKDTDYIKALNLVKTLKNPVDDFFDSVMVMDKNEKIKNNRLALLGEIKELFFNISDFSKI
jgi:glycyl-tRNA synthetase beta chain